MTHDVGDENPVTVPTPDEWAHEGLVAVAEIHGGYQSTVLRVERGGQPFVAKLTDQRVIDDAYLARLEMVEALAAVDSNVVGPCRVDGRLAREVGDWSAVLYPLVQGRNPDPSDDVDVVAMASGLATLHRSLRLLASRDIPVVAALRTSSPGRARAASDQILHGDYAPSNLLVTDRGLQILDFADCGYGPIEFEVGNSLYMVLFDAVINNTLDAYQEFRTHFVAAYQEASAMSLNIAIIDDSIALRRRALGMWLDDLTSAPIGIRNSSPAWRRVLRKFVESS